MRLHVWGVQPRVINYSSTRPTKECMQEKEGFLFVLARSIVRGVRKKTDEIVRSFVRSFVLGGYTSCVCKNIEKLFYNSWYLCFSFALPIIFLCHSCFVLYLQYLCS